jgi:branched-chain amino acid transport system substrate-binding protein
MQNAGQVAVHRFVLRSCTMNSFCATNSIAQKAGTLLRSVRCSIQSAGALILWRRKAEITICCAATLRSCVVPLGATSLAIVLMTSLAGPASAQSGAPIKIGYSMSLTGGLAPNGRSALAAQQIWEEETNAKGGMLGRPVKLIYYDDKSSPSEIPTIYTKLLDIDKVDLIIGAYGTALTAPAMPIVVQRKKTFIGLLGLAVNTDFNYPNYFVMSPAGPDAKLAFTKGFFEVSLRQNPPPQSVAIVAADQEFSRNAGDGARENAKQAGLKVVYERTYPPATTDFAPIVRAVAASDPDLIAVASYPPDSVGIVRAVNELGFKPKAIGGAMVGLQSTAVKTQLGPLLNGFINYEFWLPVKKMQFPGMADLISRYQARAAAEGVDPLGYYMPPWAYAQLQVLQQAVEGTKSLDDTELGDYIRLHSFRTVVGDVKFGAQGEWAHSRVLQVQYQNIKGHDLAQFRDMSTQVVVAPAEYASGEPIYPYEWAK